MEGELLIGILDHETIEIFEFWQLCIMTLNKWEMGFEVSLSIPVVS